MAEENKNHADSFQEWLSCPGAGSITHNKLNGGVTTINRRDCLVIKSLAGMLDFIGRLVSDDFSQIVIRRAKIGYSVHVERIIK